MEYYNRTSNQTINDVFSTTTGQTEVGNKCAIEKDFPTQSHRSPRSEYHLLFFLVPLILSTTCALQRMSRTIRSKTEAVDDDCSICSTEDGWIHLNGASSPQSLSASELMSNGSHPERNGTLPEPRPSANDDVAYCSVLVARLLFA